MVEIEGSQDALKSVMDQLKYNRGISKFRKLKDSESIRQLNILEERIILAALLFTYCPSSGGYLEGPAVEDTVENLMSVVTEFTNISAAEMEQNFPRDKKFWWPTVEQVSEVLHTKGMNDELALKLPLIGGAQ